MPNTNERSLDSLFKAYKIGGLPLVLVCAGLLTLSAGTIVDGWTDFAPNLDPALILLAGVVVMLTGAAIGVIEAVLGQRLQLAVTGCLQAIIGGAGDASTDGSNYKTAIESGLEKFPEAIRVLTEYSTAGANKNAGNG